MDALRQAGHEITFDWLVGIEGEEDVIQKTHDEREGVINADILVYLWEADQESARYEAGMARGLKMPIIVSGGHGKWFLSFPEVIRVDTDAEIIPALSGLS